jgi:hypothetical protein
VSAGKKIHGGTVNIAGPQVKRTAKKSREKCPQGPPQSPFSLQTIYWQMVAEAKRRRSIRKCLSAVNCAGKRFGRNVSVFPSVPQTERHRLLISVFLDYGQKITVFEIEHIKPNSTRTERFIALLFSLPIGHPIS